MPKKKEEILEECPATPEDDAELLASKDKKGKTYEKEIVGADGKKYIKTYSADGSSLGVRPVEEVKE